MKFDIISNICIIYIIAERKYIFFRFHLPNKKEAQKIRNNNVMLFVMKERYV